MFFAFPFIWEMVVRGFWTIKSRPQVEERCVEYCLFHLVDVGWRWRSICERLCHLSDFLWKLGGCNFHMIDEPWGQLFFFPLMLPQWHYRLSRHTATADRLTCLFHISTKQTFLGIVSQRLLLLIMFNILNLNMDLILQIAPLNPVKM